MTTLLPKGEPGYHDFDAYPFDPDKAKQLLADAGHPNGQGLENLTYTYRQRDVEQRVAEQIQAQLKENLGLDIKVQGVAWKDMLTARQAHQYDMFYGSWGHDYPDPQDWLYALFELQPDPGRRPRHRQRSRLQRPQLRQVGRTGQRHGRPGQGRRAHEAVPAGREILLKAAPMVPLYQATRYWEVSPKWTGY